MGQGRAAPVVIQAATLIEGVLTVGIATSDSEAVQQGRGICPTACHYMVAVLHSRSLGH